MDLLPAAGGPLCVAVLVAMVCWDWWDSVIEVGYTGVLNILDWSERTLMRWTSCNWKEVEKVEKKFRKSAGRFD